MTTRGREKAAGVSLQRGALRRRESSHSSILNVIDDKIAVKDSSTCTSISKI
jgi:hypothetical protein